MTQKYDKEFKLHAVQLVSESGKPASQVARELGVSQKTLYGWMSKCKENPSTPFVGSGNLQPEAKALRDLERELRDLREENAILKKAVRIFSNDRK
jgi:transposase